MKWKNHVTRDVFNILMNNDNNTNHLKAFKLSELNDLEGIIKLVKQEAYYHQRYECDEDFKNVDWNEIIEMVDEYHHVYTSKGMDAVWG